MKVGERYERYASLTFLHTITLLDILCIQNRYLLRSLPLR